MLANSEITSRYKGGVLNFVDKKGALVKRVGQGWGSDPFPHSEIHVDANRATLFSC